jgi:predicted kinase
LARRHHVPVHAIAFTTDAAVCRARNREREHAVPAKSLNTMIDAAARAIAALP